MASLIKNQIIKRLSKWERARERKADLRLLLISDRFVKNLSSNQINLSTLKGEGELSSINLDEKALEEVTELPTWLKIQKATCGRVFIKVFNGRFLLFSPIDFSSLDSMDQSEDITNSISKWSRRKEKDATRGLFSNWMMSSSRLKRVSNFEIYNRQKIPERIRKILDLSRSISSFDALFRLLGKYGFTNRVIDGISLSITNLTFQIKAQGFKASIFVRRTTHPHIPSPSRCFAVA